MPFQSKFKNGDGTYDRLSAATIEASEEQKKQEKLRALVLAMYADDAQYPQLRLPEMQKERLEQMMKLI